MSWERFPSYKLTKWRRSWGLYSWWRHQMESFSVLLTLCEGNPLVTGGFLSQRVVTRSFDVFFDLLLNKRLSKQSRRQWFETSSRSLWRHSNVTEANLRCRKAFGQWQGNFHLAERRTTDSPTDIHPYDVIQGNMTHFALPCFDWPGSRYVGKRVTAVTFFRCSTVTSL